MASEAQKIETETELEAALAGAVESLYVVRKGISAGVSQEYATAIELDVRLKSYLLTLLPNINCTTLALDWLDLDIDDIISIVSGSPNLTKLDLPGNNIGVGGATVIAHKLPNLTKLELYGNNIGDEGAFLIAEHLTALTDLRLASNDIGDEGARAISERLSALTRLTIYRNRIGDGGASAIAEHLTTLSHLDISNNDICDSGARAFAKHMTALFDLDLSDNKVGDDGAVAIAERLATLGALDLANNNIGEAGGRALLSGFAGRNLFWLNLDGNPLTQSLLSPEAFNTSDASAILAAWEAQTKASEGGRLVPLDEAKMLVLGDEAVGKTSLVRFLIRDLPRDPDEKATRGARLHERIATEGWTPEESGVRLNVWDFGGQEIQHGTHRYFLTQRSLYLIVLEDRREDRGDARAISWLRVIESVAGQDAPVLIVINKCDGDPQLVFDETGLKRAFPQVKGVLRVACNNDAVSRASIEELRAAIARQLSGEAMPHLRDRLPAEWLAVRNALGGMERGAPVLPHEAFIALCTDVKLTEGHPVADADQQRALLRLLHDLGTVIAYGLKRDEAVALSTVRLLDPNWLTAAIYSVLERIKVDERAGAFSRADLAGWLDPADYPVERHEFIIAMMRDPALGLCFRLPGDEERFLAPEGLAENSPDYSALKLDALRLRYRYSELPRALIPRLIVKLHDYLEKPPQIWLTGARLRIGSALVIVEGDRVKQKIDVSVLGGDRRAALFTIRQTMDALHDRYRELGARAVVPMPDDPDVEESYDYLAQLEHEEGAAYPHRPSGAKHSYVVAELLDAVDDRRRAPPEVLDRLEPSPFLLAEVKHLEPWWRGFLSLAVLLPAGAALFGFIGAFRAGQDLYWSALLAVACFAIGSYIIRLFDRNFLFRRLLIAWIASGIGLLLVGGFAARLTGSGMAVDYGGPPTWTVAAVWIIGALVLALLSYFEAQQEKAG